MSNAGTITAIDKCADRKTVYDQLCNSYRSIDEFRTKLLEFLPLATGAGIFLLVADASKLNGAKVWFAPVGAFGCLVTVGLYAFELYGIKKCTALIETGKKLEIQLGVEGQFLTRPPNSLYSH